MADVPPIYQGSAAVLPPFTLKGIGQDWKGRPVVDSEAKSVPVTYTASGMRDLFNRYRTIFTPPAEPNKKGQVLRVPRIITTGTDATMARTIRDMLDQRYPEAWQRLGIVVTTGPFNLRYGSGDDAPEENYVGGELLALGDGPSVFVNAMASGFLKFPVQVEDICKASLSFTDSITAVNFMLTYTTPFLDPDDLAFYESFIPRFSRIRYVKYEFQPNLGPLRYESYRQTCFAAQTFKNSRFMEYYSSGARNAEQLQRIGIIVQTYNDLEDDHFKHVGAIGQFGSPNAYQVLLNEVINFFGLGTEVPPSIIPGVG